MSYLRQTGFFTCIPWRLLGILFALNLAVMIYYVVTSAWIPGSVNPQLTFLSMCGALLMGTLCLRGAWHCQRCRAGKRTICFSQLLWGLAGFIFAAGQFDLLVHILTTQHLPPYPDKSSVVQLIAYFCFITAILLLPGHNLSPTARLRVLLDSLIIMVAVATLCYYFMLAPLLLKGHGTPPARIVSDICLVLDLLSLLSVLVVALYSDERALRPVLLVLGVAATLQLLGDALHFSEMLYREYNYFSLAHTGKMLYGMLLAVAAQTLNNTLRKGEIGEPSVPQQDDPATAHTPWTIFLPTALVLIFVLLVCLIWLRGAQTFPGQIAMIYFGGFTVLILKVLRQLLTVHQINRLQKNLQEKNCSLNRLNAQLEQQATRDPLTGLPNHRALAENLDVVLAQAQLTSTACSIIFIDIDNFKFINDYYGHLIGDAVLGYFAQIVRATVRAGDIVGRWGGEEFMVMLPGTETDEALRIAEHIHVAVRSRGPIREGEVGLTCSLGVAGYPQDAGEREELLGHADQAMYVAKHLGRNQVRSAHEPVVLAWRDTTLPTASDEETYRAEVAEALLALVEAREPALARHARRVSALSWQLAQELGLTHPQARMVSLAGLLHNLGDIAMPDTLLRHYDPLNESELESRLRYAEIGAEILAPLPVLRPIATIVRTQCAWMGSSDGLDGRQLFPAYQQYEKRTALSQSAAHATSSYQRLSRVAGECTLGARIVAVADAYDILLGEQFPDRAATPAAVLQKMRQAAGSRFDPRVIEALARVHATVSCPTGSEAARHQTYS